MRDRFYHGLLPSLWDALSFTMAKLLEWQQVNTSINTLYIFAKKLEVRQPPHTHKGGSGISKPYKDRFRRYPAPAGRVAALEDENLFLLDLESEDSDPLSLTTSIS